MDKILYIVNRVLRVILYISILSEHSVVVCCHKVYDIVSSQPVNSKLLQWWGNVFEPLRLVDLGDDNVDQIDDE